MKDAKSAETEVLTHFIGECVTLRQNKSRPDIARVAADIEVDFRNRLQDLEKSEAEPRRKKAA